MFSGHILVPVLGNVRAMFRRRQKCAIPLVAMQPNLGKTIFTIARRFRCALILMKRKQAA